jgi:hypothetical protein
MRAYLLLSATVISALTLYAGDDAAPKWPEPGSRFDEKLAHADVPADRTGDATWEKPPEVISPYEANWFDYVPILWGEDKRIPDWVTYNNALRKMYVCGGMNYSQHDPDGYAKSHMPFYCTNICNQLYLRNKPGGKVKDAFKKDRTRANCVRNPSLEDTATDEAERKNATAIAKRCVNQRPLGYDLRDEGTYVVSSACPHDFDFSPVSLTSFRLWLKAKYGTLEALNAEWETKFENWEAVFPLMSDEIQAREYPRTAQMNLAPWADHREYNDDTMQAAVTRYRNAIRTVDPGAAVGYSGTQMPSAWGGFDYWKICNTIGWVEYYDCNGSREIIRSFLPRHYPAIETVPYDSVDSGLRRMWHQVFLNDAGGLVWPYNGNDTGNTLLLDVKDNQITLTPKGEILKAVFRESRNGVPCLLRHAEPKIDPIGVLHSQPSLRADWIFEVKRDGQTWINRYSSYEGGHNYGAAGREGIYKLIEDAGLSFNCYSSAQVERGELLKRGVKLFFVPRGVALSKKEIDGLTEFVNAGGVLVTDIMAGRMNENCRVYATSPIDELLGVKRAPFAFEEEKRAETDNSYEGGFGRTLEITMESDLENIKSGEKLSIQGFQEPGLQAGSAKALAKTKEGPVLFENKHGKGYAYALNFDLPNYLRERSEKDAAKLTAAPRHLMEAFAKKAGIDAAAKLRAKGSDEHPLGLGLYSYTLGEAQFYGVHVNGSVRINWEDLSDAGAGVANVSSEATIKLPKAGYVTEMRSGKSFGKTDHADVKFEKDRPVILSVLPYEIKALKAEVGEGKLADGKLQLELTVDAGGAALDHVVHAELADDKGEIVPESVVNLPLAKGHYKGAIDMSFVPGNGPWTLKLNDVASGVKAEAKVRK